MDIETSLYIVTINYNTSDHTIEMVRSISACDYKNLKIIVVDNNSNASELEKLKEIEKEVLLIRSEQNMGFSGGNNLGIKRALKDNSDYIMLLNNDTVIEPNTITELIKSIETGEADVVCPKILDYFDRTKIGYAGGEVIPYKGGVKIYGVAQSSLESKFNQKKIITFAHGCCILAKKETWQLIKEMDEKYFLYFEDTALSVQLGRLGKRILYLPSAVVYHKESISTMKYSDNYQFYFCRNRLLFIKENVHFPMKLIAYIYTSIYMLKHLLKRNFTCNNVCDAIVAFYSSDFGVRKFGEE